MDIGDLVSWARTFRGDEVRAFTRISGDEGRQHVLPDEQSCLMVKGLLTATLPSKIGGDMDVLAGEMIFRFHSPAFAEDSIRCDVRIDQLDGLPQRTRLACSWTCANQEGRTVVTGESKSVILPTAPA